MASDIMTPRQVLANIEAQVDERIAKGLEILRSRMEKQGTADAVQVMMLQDIFNCGLVSRRWPAVEQAFKSHSSVAAATVAGLEPLGTRVERINAQLEERAATYAENEALATERAKERAAKAKSEVAARREIQDQMYSNNRISDTENSKS